MPPANARGTHNKSCGPAGSRSRVDGPPPVRSGSSWSTTSPRNERKPDRLVTRCEPTPSNMASRCTASLRRDPDQAQERRNERRPVIGCHETAASSAQVLQWPGDCAVGDFAYVDVDAARNSGGSGAPFDLGGPAGLRVAVESLPAKEPAKRALGRDEVGLGDVHRGRDGLQTLHSPKPTKTVAVAASLPLGGHFVLILLAAGRAAALAEVDRQPLQIA
jgi:hypothetical protein